MASTGPTNSINDQAAEWAVEAVFGEMSPTSHAQLEAWLAADTRHRGAFVRARAWLRATEEVVIEAHSAPAAPKSALSTPFSDNVIRPDKIAFRPLRRGFSRWSGRALAGGAALAASVAAMVAVGVPVLGPFSRSGVVASQEVVTLKDGSIATLSQDAKIEISLSADYRRITLLSGEATFKVAHDKARPFVVQSGDIYAQATGTVYSVSRVGFTGGSVKVKEGSVLVWPRDERDQAVLLHAGGTVALDPGPSLPKPTSAASGPSGLPPPELAQISLDNEPVKSAVARFNRVNSTKIVIADSSIGETRIIGLYRANDPEEFARAVSMITDSQVEHSDREIVIRMK